ncbi:hypothetical protein AD943_06590 [Gluconobacter roseus]|nr:hypothetical protein AD943_06590 [Gluconobacter roseus]
MFSVELFMKKIVALVLGAGLSLSLAACDGPYDGRRDGGHHHHRHDDRGYGGQNMGGPGMNGGGMNGQGMSGGPGRQGGW